MFFLLFGCFSSCELHHLEQLLCEKKTGFRVYLSMFAMRIIHSCNDLLLYRQDYSDRAQFGLLDTAIIP